MSGIRPGSIVHLKASVLKSEDRDMVNGGLIAVQFELADGTPCAAIWVPKRAIVYVAPVPFKIGDSVLWRGDPAGVILAIDDSGPKDTIAWIKLADGHMSAFINELEHA